MIDVNITYEVNGKTINIPNYWIQFGENGNLEPNGISTIYKTPGLKVITGMYYKKHFKRKNNTFISL